MAKAYYEKTEHQAEEQRHTAASVNRVWQKSNSLNANFYRRFGGNRHGRDKCPIKNADYHKCSIKDHYASHCRTQCGLPHENSSKNNRNAGELH